MSLTQHICIVLATYYVVVMKITNMSRGRLNFVLNYVIGTTYSVEATTQCVLGKT